MPPPSVTLPPPTLRPPTSPTLVDDVPAPGGEGPLNWREELSERVGNYRKRRGRVRPEAEPRQSLELDFDYVHKPQETQIITAASAAHSERDLGFDIDITPATTLHDPDDDVLTPEPPSIDSPDDETVQLDAPTAGREEMSLGDPAEESSPLEIVVGPPAEEPFAEEPENEGIFLAPLRRRFMAGLLDFAVLLLGAAIFALIVWRVCGVVSLVPLNLAVLGVAAVLLVFCYFAVFTAIAAATPGLLWTGCEIRNLQGKFPTTSESAWRAFGVLVSASALMLGFVWSCVDSDSLTWHDRMSGTVITEEHIAAELSSANAET